MAYVAFADSDSHSHDPDTFITKYIWSQDHKVIAIQYAITAISVGIVALVLSLLFRLQLGFPDSFSLVQPNEYYQYVTMHGMIMVVYLLTALFLGGFGNYLIPLMCGARDMVFPYLNMLSFWFYLLSVIVLMSSFFVPGGPTGAGWTLYPPQSISPGTPGVGRWHCINDPITSDLHRCLHDGRTKLCHNRTSGTSTRYDINANAFSNLGNFCSYNSRAISLSCSACSSHNDVARPSDRD